MGSHDSVLRQRPDGAGDRGAEGALAGEPVANRHREEQGELRPLARPVVVWDR